MLMIHDPLSQNLQAAKFGHILKTNEEEVVLKVGLNQLLYREGAEPDYFPWLILGCFMLNLWTLM